MGKRLTLFSLRLLGMNAVIVLIGAFLVTSIRSIWDNAAFYWFITALFTFLLWLLTWLDAVNYSVKDVKNDKITKKNIEEGKAAPDQSPMLYQNWFGFAAGFLSQIPVLLVTIVACITGLSAQSPVSIALTVFLRVWNITYLQVITTFEGALPYLFFLFPVLYAAVCGLAYMNGPVQQKKMETIIERNKARKVKRVQDEWKAQKKAQQRKQSGVRK